MRSARDERVLVGMGDRPGVLTVGISLFLFVWGITDAHPHAGRRHHRSRVGHGVCAKACAPLPLWWIVVSAGAFLVRRGLSLSLYPGFGSFAGKLGWTSQASSCSAMPPPTTRSSRRAWRRWRTLSIEQLAANAERSRIGHRLYLDNCAACHGSTAHGNQALGAPDLTDADWLYGGDGEAILTSILDGRTA